MKIQRAAVLLIGLSLAGLSAWAGDMETSKNDSGIPFADASAKAASNAPAVQASEGLKSLPKGMSQGASAQAAPVQVPLPKEAANADDFPAASYMGFTVLVSAGMAYVATDTTAGLLFFGAAIGLLLVTGLAEPKRKSGAAAQSSKQP